MAEALAIVLPVFAIIALGYAVGRGGLFAPGTTKGLTDFTFTLAVPALLFRTVSTASFPAGDAAVVWISFFGAVGGAWLIGIAIVQLILRRSQADGASICTSSAYGNVVMLGIPLSYNAYGPDAAVPIAILMTLHTPLLWLAASLHIALAVGHHTERSLSATMLQLGKDLGRNPIVIAVVLGFCWQITGLGLNVHIDRVLALLAQASAPCSLVALGLNLVKFEIKGQTGTLVTILVIKLVAMPLIAAVLALGVFGLDRVSAGVVILFAAMPTGANAFLFATQYQRAVNSASGAVALGTALSAATIAAIVYALH